MSAFSDSGIPLARYQLATTADVDVAREALRRTYADGKLTPIDSARSFYHQLNVAPLGRVTLTAMDWGSGMEFLAPSLDGCFDFSSILQGSSEVHVGHESVDADPDCGVVMSPSRSLRIRWGDRLRSLNAKIEQAVLESHLAAIMGSEVTLPLEFSVELPLSGASASIPRWIRHLADEIDRNPNLLTVPLVSESFSETLLTAVLYGQPHNYTDRLLKKARPSAPAYVRRAEAYMEAHCGLPITAEVLAAEVGVSLRTLYEGFRKYREYTPIHFLRTVRLGRVRAMLLAGSAGVSVSECALRWGFTHLGRFSGDYRRRYGESPSETLRRAQGK
jgi:AraC-like DNA-binding protein